MADLNIKISDLRTRITFQKPTIVRDTGGAQKPVYTNIANNPTVWAQWINDHGQESDASEARVSVQRATVRIRHRSDVAEKWQVLKDGAPWKILSIDPVQDRNRWIEMRVERVKATV
jgi:SPP1 family predicted phage head-tail adaptor